MVRKPLMKLFQPKNIMVVPQFWFYVDAKILIGTYWKKRGCRCESFSYKAMTFVSCFASDTRCIHNTTHHCICCFFHFFLFFFKLPFWMFLSNICLCPGAVCGTYQAISYKVRYRKDLLSILLCVIMNRIIFY